MRGRRKSYGYHRTLIVGTPELTGLAKDDTLASLGVWEDRFEQVRKVDLGSDRIEFGLSVKIPGRHGNYRRAARPRPKSPS